MARILLVWEMGGGFGHILPLKALADQLAARGHQVLVATRDPIKTHSVFADSDHITLCAPGFAGMSINPTQICALSDVLWFDCGGHCAATFGAVLRSWRNLYRALNVDLVIADAAPCAIAAAQGLLPCMLYDAGFHATDVAAWPPFRDWEKIDHGTVRQRAAKLLSHLNQARAELALPAVDQLHEGFRADRSVLRNLPELDLRGARDDVLHVGMLNNPGLPPHWPSGHWRYRVLVYVRAAYAHVERMLGALSRLEDTAVLFFHDGISESRLPRAAHLSYVRQPLDLALTLPETNLVICHGGALQVQSIQYGKPSLALPLHSEQFVQARQAQTTGASIMIAPQQRADFLTPIRALLSDSGYSVAAHRIAGLHQQRCPDPQTTILLSIEHLLASRSAHAA
jgi:UDP-N-acetylglucosamine:LPS N-acetylglucosamine transferase